MTAEHRLARAVQTLQADVHSSPASSRLNWRPRRFKCTRPFRRKKKSGFFACAITFQMQSTSFLSLTSTLDGNGYWTPRPGWFSPGKVTLYPFYRRPGGPHRAGLHGCNFDPRIINPVPRHYTCYTVVWNTVLQAESSRVRYPMGSFKFFHWLNLSGRTMDLGPLCL